MFAADDLVIASRGDAQVRAATGGGQAVCDGCIRAKHGTDGSNARRKRACRAQFADSHVKQPAPYPYARVTSAIMQACFIGPLCHWRWACAFSSFLPQK